MAYILNPLVIKLEKKSKINGLCRKESVLLTPQQVEALLAGKWDGEAVKELNDVIPWTDSIKYYSLYPNFGFTIESYPEWIDSVKLYCYDETDEYENVGTDAYIGLWFKKNNTATLPEGTVVLRDRKHLSQDGLIIVVMAIDRDSGTLVSGPDLISRGFVYVRENEDIIENSRELARSIIASYGRIDGSEWQNLKNRIKDELHRYIFDQIKRNPMILPIIVDLG